jgi:steroid delta-isomerase
MPSPEEIRSTVERYIAMMCTSDVDGISELYAINATAEDPVGGEVQQGKEAITAFYGMTAPLLQIELTGPICVAGNQCAFPLLAALTMDGNTSYLDATDVLSFGEDGKITSMKAYWNPAELRPER